MRDLKTIVENYLGSTGQLEEVPLGGGGEREPPAEANVRLSAALHERLKFSDRIALILVLMLCILFVVSVARMFYYRDDGNTTGIVAGSLLANLLIVGWLRRIWRDVTMARMASSVLHELPPEQAARFISVLYWNHLRQLPRGAKDVQ